MTGTTACQRKRQLLRLSFVHVLHVAILLLPTLVLAGPLAVGWTTTCFALAITAAAILEGALVHREFHVRTVTTADNPAMRMACFVGICLLVLFWVAQIERLTFEVPAPAISVIGIFLVVCGILLRGVAIRTLGSQFDSDIRIDGAVVRSGIYSWLRHPSEIGLLLIAIGGPLLIGAPLTAVCAALILTPVSLWRMQRENAALIGRQENDNRRQRELGQATNR